MGTVAVILQDGGDVMWTCRPVLFGPLKSEIGLQKPKYVFGLRGKEE